MADIADCSLRLDGGGTRYKYADSCPNNPYPLFSSTTLLTPTLILIYAERCITPLRPLVARTEAAPRVLGPITHLHRTCPCLARRLLASRPCHHHLPHRATTSTAVVFNLWRRAWVQYFSPHLNLVLRGTTRVRDRSFASRRVV